MFHIQTLKPLPDGTYQVLVTSGDVLRAQQRRARDRSRPTCRSTSAPPRATSSSSTRSAAGAAPPTRPSTSARRCRSSRATPNAVISEYTKDNGTNNGAIVTPDGQPRPRAAHAADGRAPGRTGPACAPAAPSPARLPPPPPDRRRRRPAAAATAAAPAAAAAADRAAGDDRHAARDREPHRQAHRLAVLPDRPVALRRHGEGRSPAPARRRRSGSGTFSIASGKTGRSTVQLNRIGRKRFNAPAAAGCPSTSSPRRGPAAPSRRSTLAVTLRRRELPSNPRGRSNCLPSRSCAG